MNFPGTHSSHSVGAAIQSNYEEDIHQNRKSKRIKQNSMWDVNQIWSMFKYTRKRGDRAIFSSGINVSNCCWLIYVYPSTRPRPASPSSPRAASRASEYNKSFEWKSNTTITIAIATKDHTASIYISFTLLITSHRDPWMDVWRRKGGGEFLQKDDLYTRPNWYKR